MKIAACALAFTLSIVGARAEEIAVALTAEKVEVDAGFTGADFVLFGALTGGAVATGDAYDIVAIVRGPIEMFRLRPILREGMVWAAGPAIYVEAPGVFITAASRDLGDIASPGLRRALKIENEAQSLALRLIPANAEAAAHLHKNGAEAIGEAFLASARVMGRVRETVGDVSFRKGALFSVHIELPPTTPVGEYAVDVYLLRSGELLSSDRVELVVNKVGIERRIYELAQTRPVSYGIACVAVSLIAGWLGAVAFRK